MTSPYNIDIPYPDHLIPSTAAGDAFINRRLGDHSLLDILETGLATGMNVLFTGPGGSGKTFGPQAFASLKRMPCARISLAGVQDGDALFGTYVFDGESPRYQVTDMTCVAVHGGVLIYDEVGMGQADALGALHGLWDDDRKVYIRDQRLAIPAADDLLIVATTNPQEGYLGNRDLNEATRSRFALAFYMDYDRDLERAKVGKLLQPNSTLKLLEAVEHTRQDTIRGLSTREVLNLAYLAAGPFGIQVGTVRAPSRELWSNRWQDSTDRTTARRLWDSVWGTTK